jgi:hypothetical protein
VNVVDTVALDVLIPATAVGESGWDGRSVASRSATDPIGLGSTCGRGHEVTMSVSARAAIRTVS